MNDIEFDELIKKELQKDNQIPKEINQLFSDFEKDIITKKEKPKFINYFKNLSIAASFVLIIFLGGCTYAHVNGIETIISPLLRNLGINSKYEENATSFNNSVTKNNVTVKLSNGALDDTSLIIGYEINIENADPNIWLEINGDYKINNISIKPLSTSIDSISDTSFIYYQVFDINEIKIEDTESVEFNATISEIKEYTESETLNSAYAVYGNSYNDGWKFTQTLNLKNLQESKTYLINNDATEIYPNVNISVTEFIEGSYTNILKIKTDKTNFKGNDFEKYYKILDEQNNEISMFLEEERQYDETVYNDRLILGNINKNSKIKIEVYLKFYNDNNFSKVAIISVDLSKSTQKNTTTSNLKQYNTDEYSFKYDETWTLTPKLDSSKVGPNSAYLGALELEIPSTTNSEYTSSVYVRTSTTSLSLEEYKEKIESDYASEYFEKQIQSVYPSEYVDDNSSSEISLSNKKGYQLVYKTTDVETVYIAKDVFTIYNNKVYRITFFGSEKEFNNLSSEIDEFVNGFEIK